MSSESKLTEYQRMLISSHVGLARRVAIGFWKKSPGSTDQDEVLSVAYQGLVTAAARFDPDRRPGNDPTYDPFLAFGSFARTRITGAIQDWLRSQDHLPRKQRKSYKDMQNLGPGRTARETASLLGISEARVATIIHAVQTPPVSLDSESTPSHYQALSCPADDNTESTAMAQIVQERVAVAFAELPDLQKSVIALRYYMGMDFSEISEQLEITKNAVKVAHQEAVCYLHSVMMGAVS